MKYVALAVAAYYLFTWAVGLPWCALSGCANGGVGNVLPAYFIGILVLIAYLPLYWIRQRQDKAHSVAGGSGRDEEA
jgi:hypothetical protein